MPTLAVFQLFRGVEYGEVLDKTNLFLYKVYQLFIV
jgi:hypothetical protein